MLDAGVVVLDLAGGSAVDDEDFDLVLPSADRTVKLVRIGPAGFLDQHLEIGRRGRSVGQGVGAKQRPEWLLDVPHGLQLAGRIIGGQDLSQPVGCLLGERVAGPQEQHPVRPDLVHARPRRPLNCWDKFCLTAVLTPAENRARSAN